MTFVNATQATIPSYQRSTGTKFNALNWMRKLQTRKSLRGLTLQQLNDIGISEKAANAEAAKAFWQ